MIAVNFSDSYLATTQEKKLFEKIHDFSDTHVLQNGVDLEYFKSLKRDKERALVFVGAMDYYPNSDAVIWFTREVFSKIPHEHHIKFYIVGGNAPAEVIELGKKYTNVLVTGFVDDVRSYMDRARLAVIPLRIARGIQNKVLEAMAMNLPVVIPETIFESMDDLEHDTVFVYKDGRELYDIILRYFDDNEELQKRGDRSRNYVESEYKWQTNLQVLDASMHRILETGKNID